MNKLDLDSPYTDWLIENSRKIRSIEMSGNWLLTTYVKNISFDELENQEFFYRLFQLLSYIKIRESSVDWISNERYRIISLNLFSF